MNIQKSNKPIEGGSIDWLIWFEMIWLVTAKTEIIYANDQLEKIFKKKKGGREAQEEKQWPA